MFLYYINTLIHIILLLYIYIKYSQAIGRVLRPGQKKVVNIWRFVALETVEQDLCVRSNMNMWKQHFTTMKTSSTSSSSSSSSASSSNTSCSNNKNTTMITTTERRNTRSSSSLGIQLTAVPMSASESVNDTKL